VPNTLYFGISGGNCIVWYWRPIIFNTIQHTEDSRLAYGLNVDIVLDDSNEAWSRVPMALILFWMVPMRPGAECLYPVIVVIPEIASPFGLSKILLLFS